MHPHPIALVLGGFTGVLVLNANRFTWLQLRLRIERRGVLDSQAKIVGVRQELERELELFVESYVTSFEHKEKAF